MKTYHCYYLVTRDESSARASFVAIEAADAVSAAQAAMRVTGAACVTDVIRVEV